MFAVISILEDFGSLMPARTVTVKMRYKNNSFFQGSKANHFRALKKESGFDFDQMIFFDDQTGNCQTVSKLGVTCVLTPHGVTRAHFDKGLEQFAKGKTGTIVRL